MPQSIINSYLNNLRQVATAPDVTEHSYRPAIKQLVEQLAAALRRPLANLTLEPGHITDAGAPDAILYGPTIDNLIGYIETKDLGRDLDALTGHDALQFARYLAAFPCWILTNYLEFRLYENGVEIQRVSLGSRAQLTNAADLRVLAAQHSPNLALLFEKFLQQSVPVIAETRTLAHLLARKARLLESVLLNVLQGAQPDPQLQSQLAAFRRWLISDLSPEQFADYYAQTLTYGLFFAAYENSRRLPPTSLTRMALLQFLPGAIRPIRAIFQMLAAELLPDELDWILDDLLRLLDRADMGAIVSQLGQRRDPIVHFYEVFLSEYNPTEREARGVYYTPDEVVQYIIRSVDCLLRRYFGKTDGLVDADVTLLEPALGTGTFFAHALEQVRDNFGTAHAGDLPDHLRQHTLKNWYGFELLPAPYVLAHLKLGQVLDSMGVRNLAPQIFLTNTLSEHEFPPTLPGPFEQAISEDGRAAQRVKTETKILVIAGNPPYSGHSYNSYEAVNDYKYLDGRPLRERNPKWLQNDYVKFIRWAEWKITESNRAGYQYGIIAYITDNSYLDGVIFRGMRKHLLDSFSSIYILNLHGKTRPPEVLPQGVAANENVFEIQQGVAITFFVREQDFQGNHQLWYADLWGSRADKGNFLMENDVDATEWTLLAPDEPFYAFVPQDLPQLTQRYRKCASVTELFSLYSMGIVTGRDDLTVQKNSAEEWNVIQSFLDLSEEDAREKFALGPDSRDWKVSYAQQDLRASGPSREYIRQIAFRPFDLRYTYFTGRSRGFQCMPRTEVMTQLLHPIKSATASSRASFITRPRNEVMDHLLHPGNLALVTFRHTRRPTPMRAFVARHLVDARLLSSESNCFAFPLYRYNGQGPNNGQTKLGIDEEPRYHNLHSHVLPNLQGQYGLEVTPEQVFHYIYGLLNAPSYQDEFAALLHEDFPHIPFTADYDVFTDMAEHGEQLVALHLLDAADLQGLTNLSVGFPETGTNHIGESFPVFDDRHERVLINRAQYFTGVTRAIWDYRIGGYRPLEKWLKDRRRQTLSGNDRRHFEMFASAIKRVIDILPDVNLTWIAIRDGDWIDPLR